MADLSAQLCRAPESCVNLDACTRSLRDARSLLAAVVNSPTEAPHLRLVPCAASGLGRVILAPIEAAPPLVSDSDNIVTCLQKSSFGWFANALAAVEDVVTPRAFSLPRVVVRSAYQVLQCCDFVRGS